MGPRPVFIGFFDIFMLPSSVFHKNTPFGTLKIYEKLVGKWLWAQIYQFQTTYLGPRPILDRCIIIFIAKMMISLIYLSFLLNPYVKESWLYTFLIVWTVLAIAFWIALLTGALIMNSTIFAISLIGFILNLVRIHASHLVTSYGL